jgi:hypothetical protein
MTRFARTTLSALACGLLVTCAWASSGNKVAGDGVVHSIEAVIWTTANQTGSSQILHTRQHPDGSAESFVIPGTDDLAIDREPVIDLDPATELPIAAWIRNEGAGFGLWISRFDGSGWSAPAPVFVGGQDKAEPEIRITGRWVHLTWREGLPVDVTHVRGVLALDDLTPTHGPETLETRGDGLVPPEGETLPGSSPEPPPGHLYTLRALIPLVPGEPGKFYLWGGQDDPVPFGFSQGFVLPDGVRGAANLRARWIGGRMVISFEDAGHYYYTMRKSGLWTDLRVIELDETTSAASAQLEVEEMIRRETGASGECPAQ